MKLTGCWKLAGVFTFIFLPFLNFWNICYNLNLKRGLCFRYDVLQYTILSCDVPYHLKAFEFYEEFCLLHLFKRFRLTSLMNLNALERPGMIFQMRLLKPSNFQENSLNGMVKDQLIRFTKLLRVIIEYKFHNKIKHSICSLDICFQRVHIKKSFLYFIRIYFKKCLIRQFILSLINANYDCFEICYLYRNDN